MRRRAEDDEEKEIEDAEAQARAVEEFERVQAGLSVRSGGKVGERMVGRQNGKVTVEQDVDGGAQGVKRKFEVDQEELVRLAKTNGSSKRRASSGQDGGNAELPAFWVPSKIPDHKKADLKATKHQPTCPAAEADKPHDFTLKTLVALHFTEDAAASKTGTEAPTRSCPSCDKALSNNTGAVLAKPCGHVLCKPCSDKFQKAPEKSAHDTDYDATIWCYVCQEDVTPGRKVKRKKDEANGDSKEKDSKTERGLVELSNEGTGFAGRGKNVVKKGGLAFQC